MNHTNPSNMRNHTQPSVPGVAAKSRITRASQLDLDAHQEIVRLSEAGISDEALAALYSTTPGVIRSALYRMGRSSMHLRDIKKKAEKETALRLMRQPGMTFYRLAELMGISLNKARALIYPGSTLKSRVMESRATLAGMSLERSQSGGWQLLHGDKVLGPFKTLQDVDDYLKWGHLISDEEAVS